VGAETGEGGLADSGDVEERLGRLEGAVDVAVINETPGKRGADAGELRELDGPRRVEVDGEPEWDGGRGVVIDQATVEPAGRNVPDRHPCEADSHDKGDHRLGASGEMMLDDPFVVEKSLVHDLIVPPSPRRCRRGTLPERRAHVPAEIRSAPEVT
jgi:hypothetical protein